MLDLAFVRANLPLVQEKLALRSAEAAALLADFEPLDRERRSAITELEQLKASRNALSAQFGKLKREGADTTALSEEISALKARVSVTGKSWPYWRSTDIDRRQGDPGSKPRLPGTRSSVTSRMVGTESAKAKSMGISRPPMPNPSWPMAIRSG